MSEPAHYPYGPSGSERWLECPGSVALSEGRESPETAYAREGTIAHAICSRLLNGETEIPPPILCNRCNAETASPPCQLCGSPEYRIDREMIGHCEAYRDFVNGLRKSYDYLHEAVETKIVSTRYANFGGTVDYLAVYRDIEGVLLHIVDFKYGQGIEVEAKENTQLLCYCVLALENFPNIRRVRFTIFQPRRKGAPETVDVDRAEIERFQTRLFDAQLATHLKAGDHCRWCPAKTVCPELTRIAEETAAAAAAHFAEINSGKPIELEALRTKLLPLLDHERAIEDFFDAIKSAAVGYMQQGEHFPGWKAVERLGHRRFVTQDPPTFKKQMKELKIPIKAYMVQRFATPGELEELGYGDRIEGLLSRSSLGYRLARESERGKPVIFESFSALPPEPQDVLGDLF